MAAALRVPFAYQFIYAGEIPASSILGPKGAVATESIPRFILFAVVEVPPGQQGPVVGNEAPTAEAAEPEEHNGARPAAPKVTPIRNRLPGAPEAGGP
jgi:hypothetical protein